MQTSTNDDDQPAGPQDELAHARAAWPAMREPDYRLTWPGDMRGVVTVSGQWDYTDAGEIEAWYTRAQLEAAIETMKGVI